MTRHWVVLETGSNQRFVFGSNRLRHVVGASQLVLDSGDAWVRRAVLDVPRVQEVQLISGKAILLAPTEQDGRAVVRAVSRRALSEAPGLEITGAVGPAFDETLPHRVPDSGPVGSGCPDRPHGAEPLDHVAALRETFERQRRARADRPPQQLRDRFLPWHQQCAQTGAPASALEYFGSGEALRPEGTGDPGSSWQPVGAAVRARTAAHRDPRTAERLRRLLGEGNGEPPAMIDDLAGEDWIAVVHADGNGVGGLFHDFPHHVAVAEGTSELSLEQHCEWLGTFSRALTTVTEESFRKAVQRVVDGPASTPPGDLPRGWIGRQIMPIVVGGDDVTFVCRARLALPLVRAFLCEFAEGTAAHGTLSRIVSAYRGTAGPGGLTAAAGIAIVKRHHPFSAAYDLAEELTASAKGLLRGAGGCRGRGLSVLDVHVAFESTLNPLAVLREELAVDGGPDGTERPRVHRHSGPFVLSDGEEPLPPAVRHRDLRHLERLVQALDGGRLSAARAHDLREALDRGPEEYESRCRVVLARAAGERLRDVRTAPPGNGPSVAGRGEACPDGPPGPGGPVAPQDPGRSGGRVGVEELEELLALVPVDAAASRDGGGPRAGAAVRTGSGNGRPGADEGTGCFARIVDALLLRGVTG